MSFKILTWNINSVRLREKQLLRLAKNTAADIICLQETKCLDELFPEDNIRAAGYPHIIKNGIKAYNGVAILSRVPLSNIETIDYCKNIKNPPKNLGGRHISACVSANIGGKNRKIKIHNFYIPAGGDEPDVKANNKFAHKLAFVREMSRRLKKDSDMRAVLVGDFNIAPYEHDVWSSQALADVVSHTKVERDLLEKLRQESNKNGAWCDVARHFYEPHKKLYSWWSYRAQDWAASNRGRRLDHIWTTPALVPHLQKFEIYKRTRGWTRPSDHAPVILDIE